jgi:hypothetical protein
MVIVNGHLGVVKDHLGAVNRFGVVRSRHEYRLVSGEFVSVGAHLFTIDGVLTDAPTRYSLQVGPAVHIDLPDGYPPEELMDRFYWRYMNHSCEPNAFIRDRDVFALRRIEPWDEITFHYNTTEYELSEPFDCRCASPRCDGQIRGFRFLSGADRERLRPWLARHLLSILNGDAPACR